MRGGRRESAQKGVEVPKEDYDFESANAKFKKDDLVKDSVSSPTNGETADPMAETNGHATADDEDIVIPGAQKDKRYDKQSSFFDDISSDLKDRVEQQAGEVRIDGRAMRSEERSKNMETFGQGSVDGGSGFRGRGRGRGGRGFGERGFRGGFRGRGAGFEGRGGGFEGRGGGFRGRGRGGEGEGVMG